jgi:hypothetical protein
MHPACPRFGIPLLAALLAGAPAPAGARVQHYAAPLDTAS